MKNFLTILKIATGFAIGIFAIYAFKKSKDVFQAPPSDNEPCDKL